MTEPAAAPHLPEAPSMYAPRALPEARWKMLVLWDEDGEFKLDETVEKFGRALTNDQDAAAIIRSWHSGDFFYVNDVAPSEKFRVWEGDRWNRDLNEERVTEYVRDFWRALRAALDYIDGVLAETCAKLVLEHMASGAKDGDARKLAQTDINARYGLRLKETRKYALHLGQAEGFSAVVKVLGKLRGVVRVDDDFDTITTIVSCQNGVLDFAPMLALRGHEEAGLRAALVLAPQVKEHLNTQMADVVYDPSADAPEFRRFILSVLPDLDERWYLQKALGSALSGQAALEDKHMLNLIGRRDTGKTTLQEVIEGVMGDYYQYVAPETFLMTGSDDDADKPRPSLHSCRKAKFIFSSEPSSNRQWNGGLLKRFMGRDHIISRNPYGQQAKWKSRGLLVVTSNDWVRLSTEDLKALVQKIAPVRFPKQFKRAGVGLPWEDIPSGDRVDGGLIARILGSVSERAGFLNWLVDGLVGYLLEGLAEPLGVELERLKMQSAVNAAVRWLEESVASGAVIKLTPEMAEHVPLTHRLQLAVAFEGFQRWVEDNMEAKHGGMGKITFGKALLELGTLDGVMPAHPRSRKPVLDALVWSDWSDTSGERRAEWDEDNWAERHRKVSR